MNISIVGTGLAGLRAAAELRQAGYEGTITAWNGEAHEPYDRPPLTKELLGEPFVELAAAGFGAFGNLGVEVRGKASSVTRSDEAWSVDGVQSDAVILATGAVPSHPGAIYTIDDARALASRLDSVSRLDVIGAGWIGVELASVAASRCEVHLWEAGSDVLSRTFGSAVTATWREWIENAGITLHLDKPFPGTDALPDGAEVVWAVGVRPATQVLAENVDLSPRDAFLTDGWTRVLRNGEPVEGLFAVGDCADSWDGSRWRIGGHWNKALHDAEFTASALLGTPAPRFLLPPEVFSTQFGHDIGFVGETQGEVTREDTEDGWTMTWSEDGELRGLLTVDSPRQLSKARKALRIKL